MEKIVKECKRIPAKVQKDELENRKDLRGLLTVTIDGMMPRILMMQFLL